MAAVVVIHRVYDPGALLRDSEFAGLATSLVSMRMIADSP